MGLSSLLCVYLAAPENTPPQLELQPQPHALHAQQTYVSFQASIARVATAHWEIAVDVRTPFRPTLLTTPRSPSRDSTPPAQRLAPRQGITETAPIQERLCGWSNPPINMAQTAISRALSMVSRITHAVLPSPSTSGGKRFNG